MSAQPVIGVALGGGAGRGWAHIGVLQVLSEAGIRAQVVTGTSIGAVVGGCYAAGKLDALADFARKLTRAGVVGFLDLGWRSSGLIGGGALAKRLEAEFAGTRIEDLPTRFAAVATELRTGHEVWLTEGRIVDAMRASCAIPGIFSPVSISGRWLVDGALANPVPVSTARALGADFVLAVDIVDVPTVADAPERASADSPADDPEVEPDSRLWPRRGSRRLPSKATPPAWSSAITDSIAILQARITRVKQVSEPADFTIAPPIAAVALYEFHRGEEAIAIGRAAAEAALPGLQAALRAGATRGQAV